MNSAFVLFEPIPGPEIQDLDLLRQVVRGAFQQRRKMLRSALRGRFPGAERGLEAAGIDSSRRGETLSELEFVSLANAMCMEAREQ